METLVRRPQARRASIQESPQEVAPRPPARTEPQSQEDPQTPKSQAPARELHRAAEVLLGVPEGPDSGMTTSILGPGAAPQSWYDHLKTKWYDLLNPYVKNAYFEHFLGRGLIGASGAKG